MLRKWGLGGVGNFSSAFHQGPVIQKVSAIVVNKGRAMTARVNGNM